MSRPHKIIKLLDCIYYLVAQFGIFISAFNGSLIWVCVFGFCLIDGAIAMVFIHKAKQSKEQL